MSHENESSAPETVGSELRTSRLGVRARLSFWRRAGIAGRIVRLEPEGAVVPTACACCGSLAASSRVETRARGQGQLIVPYCGECHRHASAAGTRTLSVLLAACLATLSVAFALPVVWERIPIAVYVLLVLAAALMPIATARMLVSPVPSGHTAAGRAVWWMRDGKLACANPLWVGELAQHNQCDIYPAELHEAVVDARMYGGVLLALLLVPVFYRFHQPVVRILNLTPSRISVWVDGENVASVEPTSAESARAGKDLRLPAGRRQLETRDPDGKLVTSASVVVESGARHLFAPASDNFCFWLETTRYGRAEGHTAEVLPLQSETRFWVLPDPIDSWFAPNPVPLPSDERSTGGLLTALRQAPCVEAPAEVDGPR